MHQNNLHIQAFFDEATNTVSYVIVDQETKQCAILDSVLDYELAAGRTHTESAERIIAYVKKNQLRVQWVLETHAHADHLSAAPYLKKHLGGKIGIGEHIKTVQDVFSKVFDLDKREFENRNGFFDHLFVDGEVFSIGNLNVKVMHTPGHTPACISYLIEDVAFVGDTMFMPDYGSARTDFPGGDAAELFQSIQKIFSLPADTRIFLCHDYLTATRKDYAWETTVKEASESNIHLHTGISQEEFVAMREKRDKTLSMPKLIMPSIQVNIRAGELPEPDENGIRYLKIPLNAM